MSFYRVALEGSYVGQDVVNVLWYRNATPFADALTFFGLLNALNATVRDQVWRSKAPAHLGGYGLQEVMQEGYVLRKIVTTAFSDAFSLINDTPVELNVAENGIRAGATNGPATYVNLHASLEPVFGPGIGLPKRRSLKIGPLTDTDVETAGVVSEAFAAILDGFGTAVSADLTTTLPAAEFFPIAVRLSYSPHTPAGPAGIPPAIHGHLIAIGYRDISDFAPKRVVRMLASRLPEA